MRKTTTTTATKAARARKPARATKARAPGTPRNSAARVLAAQAARDAAAAEVTAEQVAKLAVKPASEARPLGAPAPRRTGQRATPVAPPTPQGDDATPKSRAVRALAAKGLTVRARTAEGHREVRVVRPGTREPLRVFVAERGDASSEAWAQMRSALWAAVEAFAAEV